MAVLPECGHPARCRRPQTLVSDSQGSFHFLNRAGAYDQAELAGYGTATRTGVRAGRREHKTSHDAQSAVAESIRWLKLRCSMLAGTGTSSRVELKKFDSRIRGQCCSDPGSAGSTISMSAAARAASSQPLAKSVIRDQRGTWTASTSRHGRHRFVALSVRLRLVRRIAITTGGADPCQDARNRSTADQARHE